MKSWGKYSGMFAMCVGALLMIGAGQSASAYEVTLSLYNQGFDINKFYNNGNFNVAAGIVNAAPTSLLVIVGDPANVEDVFEIPDSPNPFLLADAGADFHLEAAQPFRFQDRFDGLFSTTVDDPLLFVPDNGTVTAFQDDGLLADDRMDLTALAGQLPPVYYEMDARDTLVMTTNDGINLYITRVWRNADYTVTFDIAKAPEPGTLVLLGLGLVGIIGITRRKKKMNLKKIFPSLMLFVVIGLLTILYSVNTYAYNIGPSICAYTCGAPICVAFQKAYDPALGQPTGDVIGIEPNLKQYFELGYITCDIGGCRGYSKAPDPIEDAIMQKWQEAKDRGVDLGSPLKEVVDAWGSPGTTGKVRFFQRGDIYYLTSGGYKGKAFFVKGAIQGVYNNQENGSSGQLGFPITDEYIEPDSHQPIGQFEGGCITTDDGINYSERPKESCPPIPDFSKPPVLVGVKGPKCGKVEGFLGNYTPPKEDFALYFSPSRPPENTLNVNFTPSSVKMYDGWDILSQMGIAAFATGTVRSNQLISAGLWLAYLNSLTKDINLTVNAGTQGDQDKYGSKPAGLTLVNEEGEISFDLGFNMPDGKDVDRILKVVHRVQEDINKFGSLEETLKKFGGMHGKWPDCTPGFLGFRFCWDEPGTPSINFSGAYSLECCPSDVKGKIKGGLDVAIDLGKLELDSPRYPVGYGFFVGATIQIGGEVSVEASWETTCKSSQVCYQPDIQADVGGGLSGVFLDDAIARADLKIVARTNVEFPPICHYFDDSERPEKEDREVKLCISPKIVGEVELFSFIEKSVEANIGGKWCPIKRNL